MNIQSRAMLTRFDLPEGFDTERYEYPVTRDVDKIRSSRRIRHGTMRISSHAMFQEGLDDTQVGSNIQSRDVQDGIR
jgi:hypothetical protein